MVTTVLHVEDDPNDLLLMEAALRQSGLGVCLRSVRSGEEAIDYLHNSLLQSPNHPFPDLVLLDLKLPNMDGLATLACIRADDRLRQIPVYVLTDWDSPDARKQARASGAAGFFPKGMHFTDIIGALRVLNSDPAGSAHRPRLRR